MSSDKAYNYHPEVKGPNFELFEEAVFYGISIGGALVPQNCVTQTEFFLGFLRQIYLRLFEPFTNMCTSCRNTLLYQSLFSIMYI